MNEIFHKSFKVSKNQKKYWQNRLVWICVEQHETLLGAAKLWLREFGTMMMVLCHIILQTFYVRYRKSSKMFIKKTRSKKSLIPNSLVRIHRSQIFRSLESGENLMTLRSLEKSLKHVPIFSFPTVIGVLRARATQDRG